MADPLYTTESESATRLDNLHYNASLHDLVVQAAHREINRFLTNEAEAVQMWGWDANSLHDADRYRVSQLLRSFVYQERVVVAALKWLDSLYRAYVDASPANRAKAEAFIESLNLAAARRVIDDWAGRLPEGSWAQWLTDDKRNKAAKDLVARWREKTKNANPRAGEPQRGPEDGPPPFDPSGTDDSEVFGLGEELAAEVIADALKAAPFFTQAALKAKEIVLGDNPTWEELEREREQAQRPRTPQEFLDQVKNGFARADSHMVDHYLAPPYRRVFTVNSVMDFHDPEIARVLGWRPFVLSSSPWDESGANMPEDNSFKASGIEAELWRLKDRGYPRERIKDGLLYDLVDCVLAVQAEYQVQCFFVDRELAKLVELRGKEEQWLYQKTAEWAAEVAKRRQAEIDRWSFIGDVLGMISAVAGVLSFIPGVSLIAGPIAVIAAVGSLSAHAKAISLKGNWDVADGVTIATDVLAAIPAVGSVAKGAKAAWAAARMNKVANVIISNGGRAFIGAMAVKGGADAARVSDYLGQRAVKVITGTTTGSKIPGKVLQGAVALATQVPTAVEWANQPVEQAAKNTSAGTALTANLGQTVGEWDGIGIIAQKAKSVSLSRFSAFFKAL
ncbi:hypothetical protein AB0D49_14760 [Streptomyces sp. NPDC048290]|uniref:hypothetical protein n=1 Tax=Streptomyces sp. NPDC048290 TaxID=3155811 RepID=UPI00343E150B